MGDAPVRPDLVLVAADLLDVEPEVVADAGAAPAVALRVLGAGHNVRTLLPAVVARESFLRRVLLRLSRRASLRLSRAAELGRRPGSRRWRRWLGRGRAWGGRRRREAANGPGQRSGGRLRTHHSYLRRGAISAVCETAGETATSRYAAGAETPVRRLARRARWRMLRLCRPLRARARRGVSAVLAPTYERARGRWRGRGARCGPRGPRRRNRGPVSPRLAPQRARRRCVGAGSAR